MDRKAIGKKNRASGARFERKVREDLEKKGYIVARWSNNIDLETQKLIPAKSTRFRSNTHGFPDYLVYETSAYEDHDKNPLMNLFGVECKTNGYLDKTEKEKIKFMLENHIFPKILIAKKGEKRGQIIYEEVKHGDLREM